MASSIIHLAVTSELLRQRAFSSPERLKLGAILPDAGTQTASHLKISVCGNQKKTYDLDRYRTQFGAFLRQDTLYLGYYLHLIQDLCFRHFLYETHRWNPHIPGNVEKLHRDYAISNAYVIARYGLQNDIVLPADFDREPINRLCRLDAPALLEALQAYFASNVTGTPFFFTSDMADAFIREAAALCLKELDAMERGEPPLDACAHAWNNVPAQAAPEHV